MKKSIILCLGLLLIAMTGCNKDKNTWGKLEPNSITIQVGETYQLNFTHDGNKFPTWASSDETVATVDETGLVTGVGVGEAEISVNGLICKVVVMDGLDAKVKMPDLDFTDQFEDVDKYMSSKVGLTLDVKIDTLMAIDSVEVPVYDVNDSIIGTEMQYDTTYYVGKVTYLYTGLSDMINEYIYEFLPAGNLYSAIILMDMQDNFDIVKQYIQNRYQKASGENYQYVSGSIYVYEVAHSFIFTKDKNYQIPE